MKNTIIVLAIMLAACTQATPSKPIEAKPPAENKVLCTQDAKQCADGSWVGRSSPNCEFICK